MQRSGGSGGGGYGQRDLWALEKIPVFEPPSFTDPGQVTRPRYRAEPYVRPRLPERDPLDATVTGFSPTHLLIPGKQDSGAETPDA